MGNRWTRVLTLDEDRQITSGSTDALNDAIRRGADLHVVTRYRHAEHVDAGASENEVVDENMDFRLTCLIDDRWSAGFTTARVPVVPPDGFGPRPSLSLFLYNQDGLQALARPFLDGQTVAGDPAVADMPDGVDVPRYHAIDSYDADTLAPIRTYIYDFDFFHYLVRDAWREVAVHEAGTPAPPTAVAELGKAFTSGSDVKVGISGLNDDLASGTPLPHEVFVHVDHLYHYKDSGLLIAATQPVVRTSPAIPVVYHSGAWDFGWLMARSDGNVDRWLCDPRTQKFAKSRTTNRIRWFVYEA